MPREESVEATPPASSGLRRLEDCGQLVGRGRLEDGSQGASLLSQGPQVQRNDGGGIVGNAFSQVGEQRRGNAPRAEPLDGGVEEHRNAQVAEAVPGRVVVVLVALLILSQQ